MTSGHYSTEDESFHFISFDLGDFMTKDHKATEVKLEHMPFFRSMKQVQDKTGIDTANLLKRQAGFKAQPSRCICGHEWSSYDVVINVVSCGVHDWDFMKQFLVGDTEKFFYQKTDLKCDCGIVSEDVGVLYDYSGFKRWPP